MSKESVEQAAGKLYPKPKAVVIPDDYYNEDFCNKTMEMEMLQSAFFEGVKWKSSNPDAAKEEEAVAFAEWIRCENWEPAPKEFNKWYRKLQATKLEKKTTSQLYTLYKQNK